MYIMTDLEVVAKKQLSGIIVTWIYHLVVNITIIFRCNIIIFSKYHLSRV